MGAFVYPVFCLCFVCVLFGNPSDRCASQLTRLFTEPLVHWTSAPARLRQHADKSEFHKNCVAAMTDFLKVMENKSAPVRQLMVSAINDRAKKNRAKLVLICQSIISCGQQNVALRGHRDDFKHFDTDENPENFQVFLELRLKGDDRLPTEHFMNAPRNMTYRSKITQNEIIQCCGEYIRNTILNEIKEAKFFQFSLMRLVTLVIRSRCHLY